MAQLRFTGLHPDYVRIECSYQGDGEWTLTVLEADDARYIDANQRTTYPGLAWEEAVAVVAAVLDGIVPAAGDDPY